jgi:hypothetical protein
MRAVGVRKVGYKEHFFLCFVLIGAVDGLVLPVPILEPDCLECLGDVLAKTRIRWFKTHASI